MLSRWTGCQSHLSRQIVRCDQKRYEGQDRADEELTGHELKCLERKERRLVSWNKKRSSAGLESNTITERRSGEQESNRRAEKG